MALSIDLGSSLDSVSVSAMFGAVALSVMVYYGAYVIYNLYFHPLAKFPGPKYAAATDWWYARALARGSAPIDMSNFHRKYGPVVRVAPDELVFTSPGAWKEIYGHKRAGRPELAKDKKYHSFVGEPILINADREYHSTLRKLLSHGFSDGALRAQEPAIKKHVDLLITRLREQGSDGQVALDILSWYNCFTFDIIGYLTYGQSFNSLADAKLHTYAKILLSFVIFASNSQIIPRLPAVLKYPFAMYAMPKKLKDDLATMRSFSEAKVNYRLETPPDVPDFMVKLVEAYQQGKMSFNQLVGNSDILMGAGSETTATTLSGLTYLLMTNPRVLAKLTQEIRQEFSSAEYITVTGVNKCKYLLACIEETLRIYPPSPATHPRYTPSEGITIDGQDIPGNVAVGIAIYAACHSADNFADADKFVPERWTGEDPKYKGDKKDAAQVFSYGPRNCAGRNLAYVEMKLVMASILWHFDLENCEPGNWFDQKIFMVWEKRPLMVKFKPIRSE